MSKKHKQPIVYHGMLKDRASLESIAGPHLPPDSEVEFAWLVQQGRYDGRTDHLTYWFTRNRRFFNVSGVRYHQADKITSWEFATREIKRESLDRVFSGLLDQVKKLKNVKIAEPVMREAFMRMLAKAEEFKAEEEQRSTEIAAEDVPFRGTIKLGGIGIEEPREN